MYLCEQKVFRAKQSIVQTN